MCLAIPAQVVALQDDAMALVDVGGVRKQVSLALVPEASLGDYVIVHVGYAIGRLDPDEAERTLALFGALQVDAAAPAVLDAAAPADPDTTAPADLDATALPR
jgi:hydrogenase expression/formation protein HypC